MLRLREIKKSYTTAGFTQNALDGVSIAFRNNEFAAVLGPSGSGKTTMLNIIGGLDRYDSGDLEIDSISTENYKSHDWDTYRNNRIGFVFQSYNLIPHQSVLSNVELALTLSGVSKAERRRRAKMVLTEVGLEDHIRKKPGQLSGGQMQRVAIARALINDPEILLADEPTGALDTETSKQVMELLTKIAKDRLVIMVTHNSALAEKYANRTITLTDGKVTSDNRPYDPTVEEQRVGREPRKASMSFWTAIMLSFSNLMTKKGRTLTTAFAGSIGIIGIATILALSNGINVYIQTVEEETMSVYPLVIGETGFNLSAIFTDNRQGERREERPEGVREMRIIETLFSTQNTNDLASLKEYFSANEQVLDRYVSTIHYSYDITPQIFLADTSRGADQVNPDSVFSRMSPGEGMGSQAGMGFMPGMSVYSEMPNNVSLYEPYYDILAGHWPSSYDEAVLVLGHGSRTTDFVMYSMGIRDRAEFKAIIESFMSRTDHEIELTERVGVYSYETILSASFKVIHPADMFQYDDTFDVWVDKSGDSGYMESLVNNGIPLNIVGIVQPSQDASANVLSTGVNYTPDLISYLMTQAADMPVVKEQLENPDINVLTGVPFSEGKDDPEHHFDFSRIISVDESIFKDAFQFGPALDSFDFSDIDLGDLDFSGFDFGSINLSGFNFNIQDILSSLDFSSFTFEMPNAPLPQIDLNGMVQSIASQVNIVASDFMGIIQSAISDFFASGVSDFSDPGQVIADISAYISNPEVIAAVSAQLSRLVDQSALEEQVTNALQDFVLSSVQSYVTQTMEMIMGQFEGMIQTATEQVGRALQRTMGQLTGQMQSVMQGASSQTQQILQSVFEELSDELQLSMQEIDGGALAEAFQIDMKEEEVLELMMSIMNPAEASYDQILAMLGYADPAIPSQILIFPRSFEAKQETLDILEQYNSSMEELGESDKVIYYMDIVGMMMSTVTEIVDMVSYALVAFVSVSLIVSSIMIGVITFISVLERKKEIGILRAIGASKGNIRLVFNAETLIIGFVAGVIGVLATFAISIVANIIINNELGIEQLVLMPIGVPVILVAISMFLSYIAGLLPASAAAGKAPVEALRSE